MRESSFTLNDPNKSTAFLPFGSGIRACVGQKFVIKAVAMLFVSLLEHHVVCSLSSIYVNFFKSIDVLKT